MDLYRHLTVLRRFWPILVLGVLLAVLLAVFAAASPTWDGGPKLKPRGEEVWTSTSKVMLTTRGFPEGRVGAVSPSAPQGSGPPDLSGRAFIYQQWALSDSVRSRIGRLPRGGRVLVEPVQAATASATSILPILAISTSAASAKDARALNLKTVAALKQFVATEQSRTNTPRAERVVIAVLNTPTRGFLAKPRTLTLPIAAFILTLIASLSLIYILENLRLARARRMAAMLAQPLRPAPAEAQSSDDGESTRDLQQVN